jgi:hypothetical protein
MQNVFPLLFASVSGENDKLSRTYNDSQKGNYYGVSIPAAKQIIRV